MIHIGGIFFWLKGGSRKSFATVMKWFTTEKKGEGRVMRPSPFGQESAQTPLVMAAQVVLIVSSIVLSPFRSTSILTFVLSSAVSVALLLSGAIIFAEPVEG